MNSKEYQEYIKKFDKYPKELNLVMYALGLGGEAGEVQEKVKKLYRDKGGNIDHAFTWSMAKELGDVLWYVTMICNKLGLTLEEVMGLNRVKLDEREAKGLISGDGDDREE